MAETTHTHVGHDAHAGHTHGACCSHGHHHGEAAPAKVLDPVCGMTVDPATAKNRLIYQGMNTSSVAPDAVSASTPIPRAF